MENKLMRVALTVLSVVVLCACQQMGPTEVGLKYRKLPSGFGPLSLGGIGGEVIQPGEQAVLMPWDSVYKFDTSVRDVSWPSATKDRTEGFVNTRALDGNEVALAMTVRYQILREPESLRRMIQTVATNDIEVRDLVATFARADIRTYMNSLRTADFLDEKERYKAVGAVHDSLYKRLDRYGIKVQRVILDDFRFERLLRDGTVDASYQEKITDIQKLREDTERERLRIETVRAKKQQEFNQVQAQVNRRLAEAEGALQQAKARGDAYFQSKVNEAGAIREAGLKEVQGLKLQVEALSGPGAASIVRLEIAKRLQEGKARFVVVNPGQSGGAVEVSRMDTNELMQQLGILEGVKEDSASTRAPLSAPSLTKDKETKGN